METKTIWTPEMGWHEIERGSTHDVHVCTPCAANGHFEWTPNAATTCRRGHVQS